MSKHVVDVWVGSYSRMTAGTTVTARRRWTELRRQERTWARDAVLLTYISPQAALGPIDHLCGRCGGRDHGKPRLRAHRLHFSASSAGNSFVIAVSKQSPLGVDIVDDADTLEIDDLELAPLPVHALLRSGASPREAWASFEAGVKALGIGIGYPFGATAERVLQELSYLTVDGVNETVCVVASRPRIDIVSVRPLSDAWRERCISIS